MPRLSLSRPRRVEITVQVDNKGFHTEKTSSRSKHAKGTPNTKVSFEPLASRTQNMPSFRL